MPAADTNNPTRAISAPSEHADTTSNVNGIPGRTILWRLIIPTSYSYHHLHFVSSEPSQRVAETLNALIVSYNAEIRMWTRLVASMFTVIVIGDGIISEVCQCGLENQNGQIKVTLASFQEDSALTSLWTRPEMRVNAASFFRTYRKFLYLASTDVDGKADTKADTKAECKAEGKSEGKAEIHACVVLRRISLAKVIYFMASAILISVAVGATVGGTTKSYDNGVKTTETLVAVLAVVEALLLSNGSCRWS